MMYTISLHFRLINGRHDDAYDVRYTEYDANINTMTEKKGKLEQQSSEVKREGERTTTSDTFNLS